MFQMTKYKVYTAPEKVDSFDDTVFLAGTIDMGNSENWQETTTKMLIMAKFNVLNPRRKSWNPNWEQSIKNIEFKEQVDWELNCLDHAEFRLFNFLKDSKSPITLMELGLLSHRNNNFVVCPDGFWRKGNVEVVCERASIPLFDNLDSAIHSIIMKRYDEILSGARKKGLHFW